ncbi:hypothetical protein CMO84_05000 [Candidatus Woesearchaeota archaeon]|nr:hypothetical protein [Candidatus Woesearchaeota archaeon]MDP6937955.1 hypothetical protein [Planctomycetota bacterium]
MQTSSRLPLALLVVGLLLGICGLVWKLTSAAELPIEGPNVPVTRVEVLPESDLVETQLMPSSSEAVAKATNLVVLVLSEDGRRLPEAEVSLTNSDGELFSSMGGADLRNCLSGDWDLLIRQKGVINHRQEIHVAKGTTERVVAHMARVIRITGTASNVFGNPPGTLPIWFLAEGETHPTQRQGSMKLAGSVINSAGEFQVDVPKKGSYRVSVGPIGEVVMATKEAVELHPGGFSELTIVVGGGTDLDVTIDPVPLRVSEGGIQLNAALMVRGSDLNAGSQKRKRPGFLKRPPVETGEKHVRNRGRQADDGQDPRTERRTESIKPKEILGPDQARPDSVGRNRRDEPGPGSTKSEAPQWQEFRRATISPEGRCNFGILPTGLDMRLAITRPRDRYESTETFRLQPNTRTALIVQIPGVRAEHIVKAQPIAELPMLVDVLPPTEDDLKPGFTWK